MNVADYVTAPTVLDSLAHHREDAQRPAAFGDRLLWLDADKIGAAQLFISARSIHEMAVGEDDGGTDVHTHEADQIYLIVPGETGAPMRVVFELDGSATEVTAPATLYIPARVPHRLTMLEGTGTTIAILLQGRYA